MMRYVFGEEAYRRVITYYLKRHAYGLVETNDLYQAFQDVLGVSPSWFFEQWIYRGGEPHYAVSYQDVTTHASQRQTVVSIRQVHETNDLVKLFTMPMVFEVHYRDGDVDRTRRTIARESETVTIPNTKGREIAFVLCDPGSWITKRDHLSEILRGTRSTADRRTRNDRPLRCTARADGDCGCLEERIADKSLRKGTIPALRAEVIKQIGGDDSPDCRTLLTRALADPAVEVRSAALAAVDRIPEALRPAFERLVTDSSYMRSQHQPWKNSVRNFRINGRNTWHGRRMIAASAIR